MKKIAQGAEAIIYYDVENNNIIKDRVSKRYRIKELDNLIRNFRTKREAKVLNKLREIGVMAPKLVRAEKNILVMEKISGKRLRDVISKDNCRKYCEKIGEYLAKMHDNNIIHADLTTSNVLISDKLVIIDFGLSFFSTKIEDKAVDIHLFKETLRATHPELAEDSLHAFFKGYGEREDIIKRLDKVESRGRYKKKK